MDSYSLDHLSPEEFEEFCYDLLNLEGFKNLSWRKGTGLGGSPPDQGRDIQGQKPRELVGNRIILETWFFECKHYRTGVPPDKIQGALSWAVAERPDYLVLIASGAFANSTKNYLEDYQKNNRPAFHIQLIERKELQDLFMPHRSLLERYQIGPPTTTIALKDHLDQWDDASLAKVMRIILDAAKSSHVALAPTGESKGVTVRVDLSAEHAGALRQVMADESRKEHRGIKLVPELLSRDLGINRSKSTEFSYNITTDVIDGFMPVILGITPVDRERPSDEQE